LNNYDADVRLGDILYHWKTCADDITLFSTNVQDIQDLVNLWWWTNMLYLLHWLNLLAYILYTYGMRRLLF